MFYAPTPSAYLDRDIASVVNVDTMDHRSWALSGFIPGGIIPMSEIRIGETCYRLRESVWGEFLPADDGACTFWVEGFSPLFIGQGRQADAAYCDWRDLIHESFQELYRKRPFEMNAVELERWHTLEGLIDVVGYRNETPIVVRQVGQITQARPLPRRITWIDGNSESVRLENMPPEFASYKPGQPFEADVERDPVTWRMRAVRFVRRIHSVQPMADGELYKFWQSFAPTSSLPASERDWTEI